MRTAFPAIKISAIAATAISIFGIASQAQAITFTKAGTSDANAGFVSNVPGATTVTFDNGSAPTTGFATYSAGVGTPGIVQGSKVSQYATPFLDKTSYLTISPVGSNVPGSTGSVTINFQSAIDYFGLYWGSIDTYNFIDFYQGDKLLKTFSGQDITSTPNGNWTSDKTNIYVNFFAEANKSEAFTKVVLRSTGIAFESDSHAYRVAQAVPEPGTVLGLLALGSLSVSSAFKRKQRPANSL